MILASLILSIAAHAAAPAPLWEAKVDGAPRAVYFDAGAGTLLVSYQHGKQARVGQLALDGKPKDERWLRAEGEAGPLRRYDEDTYWLVSGKLLSFDEHGRPRAVGKAFTGPYTDVTVLRGNQPLVVGPTGVTTAEKKDASFPGATGVFQRLNEAYVVFNGRLGKIGDEKSEKFCDQCRGLELTSNGAWLSVEGKRLIRRAADGKTETWLSFASEAGRPAYVFRKDPADDFVVVPFPAEGKLRAYRGH